MPNSVLHFSLEYTEEDAATLEFMQGKCRGLYNWWVMRLHNGEKWPGWEEAKKTLQASKEHDPELRYVYGKLLHEAYFRAWLGPHMEICSMWCADVFPAIDDVNTFEHF